MTRLDAIRARLAASADLPWSVDLEHGNHRNYFVVAEDHYQIASTQHIEDADLIANAPADLRYLEGLLEQVEAGLVARRGDHCADDVLDRVRAILKATDNDD